MNWKTTMLAAALSASLGAAHAEPVNLCTVTFSAGSWKEHDYVDVMVGAIKSDPHSPAVITLQIKQPGVTFNFDAPIGAQYEKAGYLQNFTLFPMVKPTKPQSFFLRSGKETAPMVADPTKPLTFVVGGRNVRADSACAVKLRQP